MGLLFIIIVAAILAAFAIRSVFPFLVALGLATFLIAHFFGWEPINAFQTWAGQFSFVDIICWSLGLGVFVGIFKILRSNKR